jgi:Spy/CpxP family protein refolding chaperone
VRQQEEKDDMKRNRWIWTATLVGGLALAFVLALTVHHALAFAQPAPAPPDQDQVGQSIVLDDDDAPSPDDMAWLDDGPAGQPMEAPQGGTRGGWGGGPGGMGSGGHRGGRGPGMGRGRGGMGAAMRALDLTSDQKKRMADIRDRQQRSAIKAQADMRIAQLDLQKLMRADTPDRRAVDSQIEKLGTMRTAMQKSRVGMMFDMRAVLTQDQRDKLKDWRENGRPRGEDERGGSDSD